MTDQFKLNFAGSAMLVTLKGLSVTLKHVKTFLALALSDIH